MATKQGVQGQEKIKYGSCQERDEARTDSPVG